MVFAFCLLPMERGEVNDANETNTGGGSSIGGNVGTGGGRFIGRDSKQVASELNLNLAGDADRLILFQLSQLSVRIEFIERDVLDLKAELMRWQSSRMPSVTPMSTSAIIAIILSCFLLVIIISVVLFLMVKR